MPTVSKAPVCAPPTIEMAVNTRVLLLLSMLCCFAVANTTPIASATTDSDVEEQLKVLSKQVTALLERRREDLQIIEESMRKKLTKSQEFEDVREEMKNLRFDIEQMRTGGLHKIHKQHASQQDKNERLTLKWLSNGVSEIKTELAEVQATLNATVILQNHEQLDTDLSLLRTDVSNLNRELEIARNKNVKYEAELMAIREELNSVKDHSKATAVVCGKTKNQMKALQLEWNFNWNSLNEKRSAALPLPLENLNDHPSRHQRILRRHIVDLEKASKHLRHANEDLQTKILKLEEEVHILQNSVRIDEDRKEYDRITGNQVDHYLNTHKINEISGNDNADVKEKLIYIEEQQRANTENLMNMTLQLTNFDKLHMSMLELLENVESLENKVNKNFPEFRKEISKLEVQMTETTSKVSALKEDQSNIRASMKAIGVSVSNMKDKYDEEHKKLNYVMEDVDILKTSDTLQNSKLHNHILKAESQTVELNATKSTIHLVQELKTFEKEYKNIINKLPYDCNLVSGPGGVYLISPGEGEPIMAHCDDGWTMIQKREDGSVNFNRNWNDYSNGFGSATGEHWLGNRHLHALTRENCTKLQINMRDIYGKYWQANYDDFRVADYTMGFKLVVDRYSGNASDALDYQNRMEFSTVDNDRDISNTHCASNYEGGWWFSHCQHANLNGRYNLGLTWFDSSRNEWIAVSHSEMKIKRRTVC